MILYTTTKINNDKNKAKFPRGLNGLNRFLHENTQYPQEAIEKGIKGRVIIHFIVDNEGNVLYPRVYKGVHPLLDQEALRVVSLMPKWKTSKKAYDALRFYNLLISRLIE